MNRIITIPNIITMIRLICLPFLFVVIVHDVFVGAIFTGILSATDYFDGYIARHFHQESKLGRIIDPLSDRLLFFIALVAFIIKDAIPLWFVVIYGLREIAVALGTVIISLKKHLRLDVNHVGKIGAFAGMVATSSWVFQSSTHGNIETFWLLLSIVSSAVAIIAGYKSLVDYLSAFKKLSPTGE
jgi:cardiolipin synthase